MRHRMVLNPGKATPNEMVRVACACTRLLPPLSTGHKVTRIVHGGFEMIYMEMRVGQEHHNCSAILMVK